jgi:hypothetical protein
MKPKVLITVRGGIVVGIQTTEEMEVFILDHDNEEDNEGKNPVQKCWSDLVVSHETINEIVEKSYN